MNNQQQEAFSALFDGEVDEFEMRRLLAGLDDNALAKWGRYQLVRDSANHSLDESCLAMGMAGSITEHIADEPFNLPDIAARSPSTKKAGKESWLKPLGSFAAAASIAFVAVLGVQNLSSNQSELSAGFIANGNVSSSQLPISTGVGLNQVSGSSQVMLDRELQGAVAVEGHDEEILQHYLQQHAKNATVDPDRMDVSDRDAQVSSWQFSSIPPGFRQEKTGMKSLSQSARPLQSYLYSDGVRAFSVFVEQSGSAEKTGISRNVGSTSAITHYAAVNGRVFLVTVVGEIPVETAKQVALSIRPAQ